MAIGAGYLRYLNAKAQVNVMVAMKIGEYLSDLGAEHAQQRELSRLKHRDCDAGLTGSRGGLEPDPARAYDHDSRRGTEYFLQPVAVLNSSQVEHAVQSGARPPDKPRRGARRQNELGRPGPAAVSESYLVRARINGSYHRAEAKFDLGVVVPF